MMTNITTRRLTVAELFKYSAMIYQKNFKWIIAISLGVFLPYQIVLMFVPTFDVATLNQAFIMQDADSVQSIILTVYVSLAINLIFTPLAIAGVTTLAKDVVESKPVSFSGILDASLVKWGKLVLTAFLYLLFVLAGSVIILPGVYFSVSYTFYPNIVAISDKWGLSALRESASLVKGRWFATFGFILLIAMLSSLTGTVCTAAFALVAGIGIIVIVLVGVVMETLCLYFQVVITLWYLNKHYLKLRDNTEEHSSGENIS